MWNRIDTKIILTLDDIMSLNSSGLTEKTLGPFDSLATALYYLSDSPLPNLVFLSINMADKYFNCVSNSLLAWSPLSTVLSIYGE